MRKYFTDNYSNAQTKFWNITSIRASSVELWVVLDFFLCYISNSKCIARLFPCCHKYCNKLVLSHKIYPTTITTPSSFIRKHKTKRALLHEWRNFHFIILTTQKLIGRKRRKYSEKNTKLADREDLNANVRRTDIHIK